MQLIEYSTHFFMEVFLVNELLEYFTLRDNT